MRILYIAPINSVGGHAFVSRLLLEYLKKDNFVSTIDLSIASNHNGSLSIRRFFAVFKIFLKVNFLKCKKDRIYLTISQSLFGNLKDILIFCFLINHLNKVTLHLHGGSIGENLFKKNLLIKYINFLFYKKINKIIISGQSHKKIFPNFIQDKLEVVQNFASEEMYVKNEEIENKFNNLNQVRILFLSNMFPKKGYLHLFEAYKLINHKFKDFLILDFAGKFYDEQLELEFKNKIKEYKNINYYGLVSESKKIKLFNIAHIFCLPTDYLEGQPISIIEAYASGCCILTTNKPGINDIFKDKSNGFSIQNNNPSTIASALENMLDNLDSCKLIALRNRDLAEKNFKKINYFKSIEEIIC